MLALCRRVLIVLVIDMDFFISSGAGLQSGAYGSLLAGCESTNGTYEVTLKLIPLCTKLLKVSS